MPLIVIAAFVALGVAGPSFSTLKSFWTPVPAPNAKQPADVVKDAPAGDWRDVDPSNLLIMDLKDGSKIAIELASDFAPTHVANIRALARGAWWNGASIYRVQDNYVVQWGQNEATGPLPPGVEKLPPAEYERPAVGLRVRPIGFPDSYAPGTGFSGGWPVAYDPRRGKVWLTHCYGMVGAGRDLAPDTGTGGELYAVIGQAPRHLDRNIALVGRVVEGMEAMSARPRGTEALGFYKERSADIPIVRARLAADIPVAERPSFQVMKTESASFEAYVKGRANRGGDFFQVAAGGVDVCNAPVPVRRKPF